MSVTFLAGSGGRVTVGSGVPVILAGIKSWKLQKASEPLNVTNMESPAATNGVIGAQFIPSFIATSKCSLEGIFDASTGAGATTDDLLPIGTEVVLTLLLNKTSTLGYQGLTAIVTSSGPSMSLTEAGAFSAEFQITGLAPTPTLSA